MTDNDKKQFAVIMNGVADNFGGQISKDGLRLRFRALIDLDITQVAKAATFLINNREKDYPPIPTVKEFRGAVESMTGPKISNDAKAEIQVNLVLEKLKLQGRNSPIDFKDPITKHLMSRRWFYPTWASTVKEADLTWFRKEFKEAYLAFDEQEQAQLIAVSGNQITNLTKQIGISI